MQLPAVDDRIAELLKQSSSGTVVGGMKFEIAPLGKGSQSMRIRVGMVDGRRSQLVYFKIGKLLMPLGHPCAARIEHLNAIAQLFLLLQDVGHQGQRLRTRPNDGDIRV